MAQAHSFSPFHLSCMPFTAGWQSGYAAACKAVDAGSIPTPASSSEDRRLRTEDSLLPSVF
jgi:hypothetical protein